MPDGAYYAESSVVIPGERNDKQDCQALLKAKYTAR